MSQKMGPLTFGRREEQVFLGRDIARHQDYSEHTAVQIDHEVKRIVGESYDRARKILTDNRDGFEELDPKQGALAICTTQDNRMVNAAGIFNDWWQWGASGYPRESIAVASQLWNANQFAPEVPDTASLMLLGDAQFPHPLDGFGIDFSPTPLKVNVDNASAKSEGQACNWNKPTDVELTANGIPYHGNRDFAVTVSNTQGPAAFEAMLFVINLGPRAMFNKCEILDTSTASVMFGLGTTRAVDDDRRTADDRRHRRVYVPHPGVGVQHPDAGLLRGEQLPRALRQQLRRRARLRLVGGVLDQALVLVFRRGLDQRDRALAPPADLHVLGPIEVIAVQVAVEEVEAEHAARRHAWNQLLRQIRGTRRVLGDRFVRRIEEHEIRRHFARLALGDHVAHAPRVGLEHLTLGRRLRSERSEVVLEHAQRLVALLDEEHTLGTARQGFDATDSRAREQVPHLFAVHPRTQDVEQRLAHLAEQRVGYRAPSRSADSCRGTHRR